MQNLRVNVRKMTTISIICMECVNGERESGEVQGEVNKRNIQKKVQRKNGVKSETRKGWDYN